MKVNLDKVEQIAEGLKRSLEGYGPGISMAALGFALVDLAATKTIDSTDKEDFLALLLRLHEMYLLQVAYGKESE